MHLLMPIQQAEQPRLPSIAEERDKERACTLYEIQLNRASLPFLRTHTFARRRSSSIDASLDDLLEFKSQKEGKVVLALPHAHVAPAKPVRARQVKCGVAWPEETSKKDGVCSCGGPHVPAPERQVRLHAVEEFFVELNVVGSNRPQFVHIGGGTEMDPVAQFLGSCHRETPESKRRSHAPTLVKSERPSRDCRGLCIDLSHQRGEPVQFCQTRTVDASN
mmetsp:Transcript_42597/g.83994  ORF Transcript_42597/g.83994 Transcript_42597/m.83994 type:complete len:220 (+) Transcript_42597:84-743(+)